MNSIRILIIILVFVGVGFVLCPRKPGVDQVNPRTLLDNVVRAESTVSYSADQVCRATYRGKTSRMRVHYSGPEAGAAGAAAQYYALLKSNYVPLVEGEDHVAGRDVWTLRLMPDRDKYPWRKSAPWKQLWVDKKTCVVLASREWTSDNKIKRSMRTESIRFSKDAHTFTALTPAASSKNTVTENVKRDSRLKSFVPRYVPGGFSLIDTQYTGNSSCRLTYSDGLYCIVIRGDINPNIREKHDTGIRDCGQCLVYSRTSDSRSVTVTADLPANEFHRLIRSID